MHKTVSAVIFLFEMNHCKLTVTYGNARAMQAAVESSSPKATMHTCCRSDRVRHLRNMTTVCYPVVICITNRVLHCNNLCCWWRTCTVDLIRNPVVFKFSRNFRHCLSREQMDEMYVRFRVQPFSSQGTKLLCRLSGMPSRALNQSTLALRCRFSRHMRLYVQHSNLL
jgi:hypothetical protein